MGDVKCFHEKVGNDTKKFGNPWPTSSRDMSFRKKKKKKRNLRRIENNVTIF